MIKTLSDWLRTFDKSTFTGSTAGVPDAVVLQAMTERLIRVDSNTGTVKLTTKGIRSKFHDKRIPLSLSEREFLWKLLDRALTSNGVLDNPMREIAIIIQGKLS